MILYIALIVFVILYLFTVRSSFDLSLLGLSLGMLLVNLYLTIEKKESFTEPLSIEENYEEIAKRCSIYLTSFNKKSLPSSESTLWKNVGMMPLGENCKDVGGHFKFKNTPVFKPSNGITLGTNIMYGPYCNMLGISLESTFTFFIACRHGDFGGINAKQIDFLKLYANSDDNNGLSLYIETDSVENVNAQVGQLFLKYTDADAQLCTFDGNQVIPFDQLNLSIYFVIKDVDSIKVLYMIGDDSSINKLLELSWASLNTSSSNPTFSNKEISINRNGNWVGSMYAFGIIPEAITDNEVTAIRNHLYGEYQKVINPDFAGLVSDYNSLLDKFNRLNGCPFDSESVCTSCADVTDWSDMGALMNASKKCKSAINSYCSTHNDHPLCKCWDPNHASTPSCKLMRSMYSDDSRLLYDNLSQADLDYIKDKYKIMQACPKPITVESCYNKKIKEPVYVDYDYDELKVKPSSIKRGQKVLGTYDENDKIAPVTKLEEIKEKDYAFVPIKSGKIGNGTIVDEDILNPYANEGKVAGEVIAAVPDVKKSSFFTNMVGMFLPTS